MAFETLLVTRDGAVATLTLNRPPLNLVTPTLLAEMAAAFDELEADRSVRAVILTGSGTRAFCAGADLGEEKRHSAEEGPKFREAGRRIVARIETLPKPVIAAVAGWCIGGGTGLAWPCDIRIAAEGAKFRAGGVYLGLIPTWSVGMVRMLHYIGRNRTLDPMLLGEDISARQALELGIVSRVVPNEALMLEANRVAARLAGGAPLPIQAIKQAMHAQYWQGPAAAAELEEAWAKRIMAGHDAQEGMRAFLEKRKPEFRGE